MNRFLLYSAFNKLNPRFFTLVGGVITSSLNLNKNPVQTFDCARDFNFFIEGSGVEMSEITCDGVFDNDLPRDMLGRLLTTVKNGEIIPSRLSNEDITLSGNFFYSSINLSESVDSPNSFNLTLLSHGDISIAS